MRSYGAHRGRGSGGTTSGPEQVVETFWKALEKQDADLLLSTTEPSMRSDFEDALSEGYELKAGLPPARNHLTPPGILAI